MAEESRLLQAYEVEDELDGNRIYTYENVPSGANVINETAGERKANLIESIRNAKLESSESWTKCSMAVIFGSVCVGMSLGILLTIPVAMIYIGSHHLYECPTLRYIPIYLVVGGCFFFVLVLLLVVYVIMRARGQKVKRHALEYLIIFFLLSWFIAGNIWIYSVFRRVEMDNSTSDNYCHRHLYLFAFWLTTGIYAVIGFSCLMACCRNCFHKNDSGSFDIHEPLISSSLN